jgi:hypothetical protein
MQTKDSILRSTRWVSVVLLAGLISTLLSYPSSLFAAKGSGSQVFSLEVRGEPLGEVLKKISNVTGYQISVTPGWTILPVSVILNRSPIDQGLRRILSNLNHSIVFNEADHRISIEIKSFLNGEGLHSGDLVMAVDDNPPGALRSSAVYLKNFINPDDIEVIPPTEPDEAGVTQKDLKEIESQRLKVDPDNIEVIPPAEPRGKGVTIGEVKAHQNPKKMAVLKGTELVPLDTLGRK